MRTILYLLAALFGKGILMNLMEKIWIIEDFPKPGISFKDITTLIRIQKHSAIQFKNGGVLR